MALFRRRPRAPYTYEPSTGQVVPIRAVTAKDVRDVSEKQFTVAPGTYDLHYWEAGFPGVYGHLYRVQPAVRTVVDFFARNIGSLTLKFYLRVGDTDREELDSHPCALLLRHPNDETTRYRLFRDLAADLAIEDVAYWLKIRDRGNVVGLARLPLSRMSIDNFDGKIRYRYLNGAIQQTIPRENLVIFSGYNPDGNPWGVSPMETLRRVLEEEWEATENRTFFWRNAGRQGQVITRPADAPPWSPEERARFREGWQSAHAGAANAGKTAVLEDGMNVVSTAFSPEASQYVEARRLTKEEVCQVYGINPKLLGMGNGDEANANVEAFHRHLYQDTLGPWLRSIEDEIELQLLPEFNRTSEQFRVYTEFNVGDKLKMSFEEQAKIAVTSAGVPITTVNEWRARLNLPRIDEDTVKTAELFDVPVMPMNVTYGGQPAVTVPTADPGSPVAAGDTFGTQPPKAKAVPPGPLRRHQTTAQKYTVALDKYFRQQERAVHTKAAAPWDADHWDTKLQAAIYRLHLDTAGETGRRAAIELRGTYNADQTLPWLQASALTAAQNINAHTAADLAGDFDAEHVAHVYEVARTARAAQLGTSLATSTINWARIEAGKQSWAKDGKERTKTWRVTSRHSRHPQMDGQTVGVEDNFSNGLAWPGDISGSADQTAGCSCLLELGGT